MATGCRTQTLTIANGATTTGTAFLAQNMAAFGLQMPAAFTGTSITFTVSADGATFQALYDSTGATAVSMSVAASRSYDLPSALTAWRAFKIVSGSAEAASRDLIVVGKAA